MKYSQIHLISAVFKEIDRQMKEAGIKKEARTLPQRHLNAVIDGVNAMLKEFERAEVPSTPGMGLAAWLASDDTGLSSRAMAHHIMGAHIDQRDSSAHPWDAADFGRCHRFLEAVPEARPLLGRMANVSTVWEHLIGAWDELTALYLEALRTKGNGSELTARIRALIAL